MNSSVTTNFFQDVGSGAYIKLINELRAAESKQKTMDFNAEGDSGRASKVV